MHTTYRPRTRTRTVYYDTPTTTYYDTPTTAYSDSPPVAAVFPPSATEAAFKDGLWSGRVESATIAGVAYYLYQDRHDDEADDDWDAGAAYEAELTDTRALMSELKAEYAQTDPLVSKIQRPRSGRYEGCSAEDDDGDQGVLTHLEFREDGTVGGWGHDDADGRYVIEDGVWSTSASTSLSAETVDEAMPLRMQPGGRVAWIEKYDRGFEVALRGQVLADGTIRAMWASTVGVSGSVDLACK